MGESPKGRFLTVAALISMEAPPTDEWRRVAYLLDAS